MVKLAQALKALFLVGVTLYIAGCVVPARIDSVIVNDALAAGTSGEVKLIRENTVLDVEPGLAIESGDRITTSANSKAVLLLENGKVEVVLQENTEVRISSLFLAIGEIYVRIKEGAPDYFESLFSYGAAGHEGTEYIMRVSDQLSGANVYECIVLDGRARITPKGEQPWGSTVLNAKQSVRIPRGGQASSRTLTRKEYNNWVKKVNEVESIYRSSSAQLLVPDVTGLPEKTAVEVLRDLNLSAGKSKPVITDKVSVGEVAGQDPVEGERVKANQSVTLRIESKAIQVPQLAGLNLDQASNKLRAAKLVVGDIEERITGKTKAGLVQEQNPRANHRAPEGSAVDLWLEAKSVEVPALVGKTEVQARELLRRADLRASREFVSSGRGKVGTVSRQKPNSGTRVKPNSRVEIFVEKACVVPSLKNKSEAQARAAIQSAGLTARVGKKYQYGDFAHSQSPSANREVQCNTVVSFNVGTQIQ